MTLDAHRFQHQNARSNANVIVQFIFVASYPVAICICAWDLRLHFLSKLKKIDAFGFNSKACNVRHWHVIMQNCWCSMSFANFMHMFSSVRVIRTQIGRDREAPSKSVRNVLLLVFFLVLCIRGNYGQFLNFGFLQKPTSYLRNFENSSIWIQKGIISLSWGGAGRSLRHSVWIGERMSQSLVEIFTEAIRGCTP